jgi:hypothetical protein
MAREGRQDRQEPRISISLPLEFVRSDEGSETEEAQHDRGTVFDLSVSGVSFYSHKHLNNGDKVEVFCKDLWQGRRIGAVRWCKEIKHNLFLVGVSLEQESPFPPQ